MTNDRDQIRQKLRIYQTTLSNARQALFAAVVPESRTRYILWIGIMGDGTARTVEIEKLAEDGVTYTMLFDNIPVPPADTTPVPEDWEFDIENPFLCLEGGTTITGISSAGTPECTVIFYDDSER